MIVLDTHIGVWWAHGDRRLSQTQAKVIEANEETLSA
jgi:PIN domain nuclease of toxin-antitoxin system